MTDEKSSPYQAFVRRIQWAVHRRVAPTVGRWIVETRIQTRGQSASAVISGLIAGSSPAMVCRLGTGELNSIVHMRRFFRGKAPYRDEDYEGLEKIAGFFPVRQDLLERYYHRMVDDLKIVDVLGSWLPEERFFRSELKRSLKVPLADLEPYFHRDPWSASLEGRTVLVVHPFVDTVRSQYARREGLFQDARVLPSFELKTLRSVQSIGSRHGRKEFRDWFEALTAMEEKIAQTEFDVALIGCGAYGLPLAAHVKRLGKKAVHLGGATQILFGIRGRRWEDIPEVARLFNDAWVRPDEADRPDNYLEIEGGSYW